MRRFVASCRDPVTNGYLFYSECSYNMACCQLESEGFECEKTETVDTRFTKIKGIFKGTPMEFLYDEERGYLLRTA